MQIKTSRKAGFTLVEIMIVVAIIGLLAAIAIPNFIKARAQSQATACINNLRQIDGAKQQWGLENKKQPDSTALSSDLSAYMGRGTAGSFPTCPSLGTYAIGDLSTAPSCTLSSLTSSPHDPAK